MGAVADVRILPCIFHKSAPHIVLHYVHCLGTAEMRQTTGNRGELGRQVAATLPFISAPFISLHPKERRRHLSPSARFPRLQSILDPLISGLPPKTAPQPEHVTCEPEGLFC